MKTDLLVVAEAIAKELTQVGIAPSQGRNVYAPHLVRLGEQLKAALGKFDSVAVIAATGQKDDDCFLRAKQRGEKTFTLVAQDFSSPRTICFWILENIEVSPAAKLREALDDALQMRSHPKRKHPD